MSVPGVLLGLLAMTYNWIRGVLMKKNLLAVVVGFPYSAVAALAAGSQTGVSPILLAISSIASTVGVLIFLRLRRKK